MKKYLFTVLLLFILISCSENENRKVAGKYIVDDLHKKIEINEIPQRVITLAPNLTELLFEIGQGEKIIGNTTYCNYPDSAKSIAKVADLLSVNNEKIIALNPDLIFITAEGNSRSDYEKLTELGFKVFVSNPRHYNGIKKTLKDMGEIFHIELKADQLIKDWDKRLEIVKKNHDLLVNNSVMFLISTSPIFTVGQKSFIHQILTYAGLINITADSKVSYPMFTREEVLVRNPDYILLYETNNNDVNNILRIYPEWNTISAIVNDRVFFINADIYSRPGPRFVEAVENLNKLVLSK